MMAPTIRSSSSGSYAGWGDTGSITLPGTISAGDLILIFAATVEGQYTDGVEYPGSIAGFTRLTTSPSNLGWLTCEVFYKEAVGNEDGTSVTYDFYDNSGTFNYVALAIQDCAVVAPNYGSWWDDNASGDTTPNSPSVSLTGLTDPLVLRFAGGDYETAAQTAPTGCTMIVETAAGNGNACVASDDDASGEEITNAFSSMSTGRNTTITIAVGTGSQDATVQPGIVATPVGIPGATIEVGVEVVTLATPVAVLDVAGYTATVDLQVPTVDTPIVLDDPIKTTTVFYEAPAVDTPSTVWTPTVIGAETRLYPASVDTPVAVPEPPLLIDSAWEGTSVATLLTIYQPPVVSGTADLDLAVLNTVLALPAATVRVDQTRELIVIATPVVLPSATTVRADSFPSPFTGGVTFGGGISVSSVISGWPDNKFIITATLDTVSKVIRWVDIYESDGTTMWWQKAPVTVGKVSVSMDRGDRRTMNLTLENLDGEFDSYPGGFWYDKVLRVYWGYEHSDGSTWSTPLGTYRIDTIVQPRFPHVVELTCRDFSSKLSTDSFSATEVYAVNSPIEVVVQQIATGGGITLYDLPGTGVSTSKEYVFEPGTSRWQAILDVCEAHNYLAYFTPEGELTMQAYPDPTTIPIKWEFKTGIDGNLADYKKQTNPNKLYNHIVVIGEDVDGNPVFGEAENTEPTSPTRIAAIGRRTAPPVRNPLITSSADCTAVAERLLRGAAQEQFEVPIQSLVLPWLDAGDVVQFTDPDPSPGDPTKFVLVSYDIDLALGPMSATLSRVTTVG